MKNNSVDFWVINEIFSDKNNLDKKYVGQTSKSFS